MRTFKAIDNSAEVKRLSFQVVSRLVGTLAHAGAALEGCSPHPGQITTDLPWMEASPNLCL